MRPSVAAPVILPHHSPNVSVSVGERAVLSCREFIKLQPEQINLAVMFWNLVKSDASVGYCIVAYTGQVPKYVALNKL